MTPVLRHAARLLVIAPDGRVLLFQYDDAGRRWWAAPGGGVEGDETFEQAAAREAAEELAGAHPPLTPLWEQTVEFTFREQSIRQAEHYFLVRLPRADVDLGGPVREAHRREGIVSSRWWSLEEIERTTDRMFPADLARRVRGLQAGVTNQGGPSR